MTAADCPDPAGCPVPSPSTVNKSKLKSTVLAAGSVMVTAAKVAHWPFVFNPSDAGDARFSPLVSDGTVVPTVYLASVETVALLETVFHDTPVAGGGVISLANNLAPFHLVRVIVPHDIRLIDLRDPRLAADLGLERSRLVACSSQHYRCTREWAGALHGRSVGGQPTFGIAWDSRVVEVASHTSPVLADVASQVCVLFGDGLTTEVASWSATPVIDDLTTGPGRHHAEQVATLLNAVII